MRGIPNSTKLSPIKDEMEGLQVCLWCPLRAYFSKCGGNCGVDFSREVRSFIVDSTLYSLCILCHSRTMEPGQFRIRTLYEILGYTIWDFEYEYSRIIWVWIHQFRYISCNWPNRYSTTHCSKRRWKLSLYCWTRFPNVLVKVFWIKITLSINLKFCNFRKSCTSLTKYHKSAH